MTSSVAVCHSGSNSNCCNRWTLSQSRLRSLLVVPTTLLKPMSSASPLIRALHPVRSVPRMVCFHCVVDVVGHPRNAVNVRQQPVTLRCCDLVFPWCSAAVSSWMVLLSLLPLGEVVLSPPPLAWLFPSPPLFGWSCFRPSPCGGAVFPLSVPLF